MTAQDARQTVGAGVEFGIAQGLSGEGQRRGLGLAATRAANRPWRVSWSPCLAGRAGEQQLLPLLGGEQRQFGNAPLRVAQQRLQQVLPVSGHPRDARFVEQVRL